MSVPILYRPEEEMYLPPEIVDIIASFALPVTQRRMRQVCVHWHYTLMARHELCLDVHLEPLLGRGKVDQMKAAIAQGAHWRWEKRFREFEFEECCRDGHLDDAKFFGGTIDIQSACRGYP